MIVKEVGWGIAGDLARKLEEAGVAAVDVAGAGGTSWSEVEKHRAPTEQRAMIAAAFVDWGIPTADCVISCRGACPELPLIASGGIRNGVEMAKALALGADLVGVAAFAAGGGCVRRRGHGDPGDPGGGAAHCHVRRRRRRHADVTSRGHQVLVAVGVTALARSS